MHRARQIPEEVLFSGIMSRRQWAEETLQTQPHQQRAPHLSTADQSREARARQEQGLVLSRLQQPPSALQGAFLLGKRITYGLRHSRPIKFPVSTIHQSDCIVLHGTANSTSAVNVLLFMLVACGQCKLVANSFSEQIEHKIVSKLACRL